MRLLLSKLGVVRHAACSIATGFITASITPDELGTFACSHLAFYLRGDSSPRWRRLLSPFAHTSRVNFSSLYEWVVPHVVFSLSFRALGSAAAIWPLSHLRVHRQSYSAEVAFLRVFRRHHITALLPAQRSIRSVPARRAGRIFRRRSIRSPWAADRKPGGSYGGLPSPYLRVRRGMLPLLTFAESVWIGRLQEREIGRIGSDVAQPQDADHSDISRKYKLSARESEVLGYLGRGRSVPYARGHDPIEKHDRNAHQAYLCQNRRPFKAGIARPR